jgi:17beta-estradiol 17-dehydrogenase / very-long-chain 3-oxoacyl-CoA reductase
MAGLSERFLGGCSGYFAIFGAVAASYIALKIVSSLLNGVKTFMLGSGANLRKFGEWAVVTGATDGIGKAYAQELARSGLNIVLVSRSLEKLEDVAAEIGDKYKVKTKVVAVDFTGGLEIYKTIADAIKGLEIGTLVNNVGMSYSHPSYIGEVPDQKLMDLINCNIYSLTLMTKVVLPQMVERKRGAIINISSGSAVNPAPLLAAYSASKAYVDFFSRALQMEYQSKGIIVQSVLPFFVATKLSKIRKPSFFAPSPTTYVRQALRTVGVQERTFGCIAHALQAYVIAMVPDFIVDKITLNQMKAVRAKAIKREQKAQ